jgi:O-methyltransferase
MIKIVKFIKDALLFIPLTLLAAPFSRFFLFISHFNKLVLWIHRHKKKLLYSDFYSPLRKYAKRYDLYTFIKDHYTLPEAKILYLEFGVAAGASFKWWLAENKSPDSRFFGFDTFEGLPEDWGGFYKKGDMASSTPVIDDKRGAFIKGLFQDTLNDFINNHQSLMKQPDRKIIHMDADLYSATAYALSQLSQYLRKGDLVFFDEFSVPMHEFKAFYEFTANFNIKLTPVGAVNNFYQVAFIVE